MFAGYFSPRFAPMEVVVMSHVLVVEDDVDVADLIRTVLTTGGHDVEVAGDGRAGLAAANARRPDVVLLDWMMPGMSGLEVSRTARRRELRADAGDDGDGAVGAARHRGGSCGGSRRLCRQAVLASRTV